MGSAEDGVHPCGPEEALMSKPCRDRNREGLLSSVISKAGLFGDTGEDFAQQSTTLKQTEAIKHILPRYDFSAPQAAKVPSAGCHSSTIGASHPASPGCFKQGSPGRKTISEGHAEVWTDTTIYF